MLLKFEFENFRSFKNRVVLDLTAQKITEHPEHVATLGKERVLKVASIFGGNGSGKSNIFKAFEFMTYYVLESFKFGGGDENSDESGDFRVTPYLFDDSSIKDPSIFEVSFSILREASIKTYNYGFSIDQEKVITEWLRYKSKTGKEFKTIFYRDSDKVQFDTSLKKWSDNINISLEKEVLIVSLGAKLKIPKLKEIRDWFFYNETVGFGNPVESFFRSRYIPRGFVDDESIREKVVDFINIFDTSIKGFEVKKIVEDDKDKDTKLIINSIHINQASNKEYRIPFSEEPSGTLKMFSIYQDLKDVLEKGAVLFIDEFNEKLHPLLVKNLIKTFLNPETNVNDAQIIFTSHDVWQLSSDLLRRDEIWFVEKNSEEISNLYSLADTVDESGIKIRKDENFSKNYLQGKYGGISEIKEFNF